MKKLFTWKDKRSTALHAPIDDRRSTALLHAAEKGCVDECNSLLNSKDMDMDRQDEYGWTALMHAAEKGHEETCVLLLVRGAALDIQAQDGKTALIWAAERGHGEACSLIVGKGAGIDIQAKDGWTALMHAANEDHGGVCAFLVEKGAAMDVQDQDGWTALMRAADKGHGEVCTLLVDKGAALDIQAKDGWTALMRAADKGHGEVCTLLVDKGAAMDKHNKNGMTALVWAILKGHKEVCTFLADKGADLDRQMTPVEKYGWTLLMRTVMRGSSEFCSLLVDKGAALDTQDANGMTALMHAAANGHEDMCRLLVGKGAALDLKDKHGQSALDKAKKSHGHHKIVSLIESALERRGAAAALKALDTALAAGDGAAAEVALPAAAQRQDGFTALILAAEKGDMAVCSFLADKGVAMDTADKNGRTALMRAAHKGHGEVCTLLVDKGVALDIQDKNGQTALMRAAAKGHGEVCTVLAGKGAAMDVQDVSGESALCKAKSGGHHKIVSLIESALERRAAAALKALDTALAAGDGAAAEAALPAAQALPRLSSSHDFSQARRTIDQLMANEAVVRLPPCPAYRTAPHGEAGVWVGLLALAMEPIVPLPNAPGGGADADTVVARGPTEGYTLDGTAESDLKKFNELGLRFDTATGAVSGTPSSVHLGAPLTLHVSGRNGFGTSAGHAELRFQVSSDLGMELRRDASLRQYEAVVLEQLVESMTELKDCYSELSEESFRAEVNALKLKRAIAFKLGSVLFRLMHPASGTGVEHQQGEGGYAPGSIKSGDSDDVQLKLLDSDWVRESSGRCMVAPGVMANARKVVVKFVHPEAAGDSVAALNGLRRELRLLLVLDKGEASFGRFVRPLHASLVPSAWKQQQVLALVMEAGINNVADYLSSSKGKQLNMLQLGVLASRLTEVVSVVNQEGYVWTDVKPDNFVRVLRGGEIEVVGVDMEGMVKEDGTLLAGHCVTPEYCAPELAVAMGGGVGALERFEVTPKLDAWALGMMLFYVFHPDHLTYFWVKGLKKEAKVKQQLRRPAEELQADINATIAQVFCGEDYSGHRHVLQALLVVCPTKRDTASQVRCRGLFRGTTTSMSASCMSAEMEEVKGQVKESAQEVKRAVERGWMELRDEVREAEQKLRSGMSQEAEAAVQAGVGCMRQEMVDLAAQVAQAKEAVKKAAEAVGQKQSSAKLAALEKARGRQATALLIQVEQQQALERMASELAESRAELARSHAVVMERLEAKEQGDEEEKEEFRQHVMAQVDGVVEVVLKHGGQISGLAAGLEQLRTSSEKLETSSGANLALLQSALQHVSRLDQEVRSLADRTQLLEAAKTAGEEAQEQVQDALEALREDQAMDREEARQLVEELSDGICALKLQMGHVAAEAREGGGEQVRQVLARLEVLEQQGSGAADVEQHLTQLRGEIEAANAALQLLELRVQKVEEVSAELGEQLSSCATLEQLEQELGKAVEAQEVKLRGAITSVVQTLPPPSGFSVKAGKFGLRRVLQLEFNCCANKPGCFFPPGVRAFMLCSATGWAKWLKVAVMIAKLGASSAAVVGTGLAGMPSVLSAARDVFTEMRESGDAGFTDQTTFVSLMTSSDPFLPSQQRDKLAQQLRDARFFHAFSYDAQMEGGGWRCRACEPSVVSRMDIWRGQQLNWQLRDPVTALILSIGDKKKPNMDGEGVEGSVRLVYDEDFNGAKLLVKGVSPNPKKFLKWRRAKEDEVAVCAQDLQAVTLVRGEGAAAPSELHVVTQTQTLSLRVMDASGSAVTSEDLWCRVSAAVEMELEEARMDADKKELLNKAKVPPAGWSELGCVTLEATEAYVEQ